MKSLVTVSKDFISTPYYILAPCTGLLLHYPQVSKNYCVTETFLTVEKKKTLLLSDSIYA